MMWTAPSGGTFVVKCCIDAAALVVQPSKHNQKLRPFIGFCLVCE